MLKKLSVSLVSVVALSACSSCYTMTPEEMNAENAKTNAVEKAVVSEEKVSENVNNNDVVALSDVNVVNFDFDSAAINAASAEKLKKLVELIKLENPSKITVSGHTDERGTREYNLALGDRRAVSVKRYLVGLGVDANKIVTVSYGKERPIDILHNLVAWAKNRRAVVTFD